MDQIRRKTSKQQPQHQHPHQQRVYSIHGLLSNDHHNHLQQTAAPDSNNTISPALLTAIEQASTELGNNAGVFGYTQQSSLHEDSLRAATPPMLFTQTSNATINTLMSMHHQINNTSHIQRDLSSPLSDENARYPNGSQDTMQNSPIHNIMSPVSAASTPGVGGSVLNSQHVRPFGCELCNKSFQNNSALMKHKLIHSEDRAHICPVCSKAFKRQDHLTGHLNIHKSVKPFRCIVNDCDKSYCDARSLKRHLEHGHNVQNVTVHSLKGTMYVKCGDGKEVMMPMLTTDSPVSSNGRNGGRTSTDTYSPNGSDITAQSSPITSSHGKNVAVDCQICGRSFKNVPALNGHMRLHSTALRDNRALPTANEQMNTINKTIKREQDDSNATITAEHSPVSSGATVFKQQHFPNQYVSLLSAANQEFDMAQSTSHYHQNTVNSPQQQSTSFTMLSDQHPPSYSSNPVIQPFNHSLVFPHQPQHLLHGSVSSTNLHDQHSPLHRSATTHSSMALYGQDTSSQVANQMLLHPAHANQQLQQLSLDTTDLGDATISAPPTMLNQTVYNNNLHHEQYMMAQRHDHDVFNAVHMHLHSQPPPHPAVTQAQHDDLATLGLSSDLPISVDEESIQKEIFKLTHDLPEMDGALGGSTNNQNQNNHTFDDFEMLTNMQPERRRHYTAPAGRKPAAPSQPIMSAVNSLHDSNSNNAPPKTYESLYLARQRHRSRGKPDNVCQLLSQRNKGKPSGGKPPRQRRSTKPNTKKRNDSAKASTSAGSATTVTRAHSRLSMIKSAQDTTKSPEAESPKRDRTMTNDMGSTPKHKPPPLLITDVCGLNKYPSQLRSPRFMEPSSSAFGGLSKSMSLASRQVSLPVPKEPQAQQLQLLSARSGQLRVNNSVDQFVPYTPPPILSPMRSGLGLYCNIMKRHSSTCSTGMMTPPTSAPIFARNRTEFWRQQRRLSGAVANNGHQLVAQASLLDADSTKPETLDKSHRRHYSAREYATNRSKSSESGLATNKTQMNAESAQELAEKIAKINNDRIIAAKPIDEELSVDVDSDKMVEDDDIDETPPETDCNPHINLGPEFQADVPHQADWRPESLHRYADRKDQLMFHPKCLLKINDRKLKSYLDLACSSAVYGGAQNKELAMRVLQNCNGNVKKATEYLLTKRGRHLNREFIDDRLVDTTEWTAEEINMFHDTLLACAQKDFNEVAAQLPNKSVRDCVSFYYTWKQCHSEDYRRVRAAVKKQQKITSGLSHPQVSVNEPNQITISNLDVDDSEIVKTEFAKNNNIRKPAAPMEDLVSKQPTANQESSSQFESMEARKMSSASSINDSLDNLMPSLNTQLHKVHFTDQHVLDALSSTGPQINTHRTKRRRF